MAEVFIPKELSDKETRVAASPRSVKQLREAGFSVSIEQGAGQASYFSDSEYEAEGAKIVDSPTEALGRADLILTVNPPGIEQVQSARAGACFVGFLFPARNPELIDALCQAKVNAFALDAIPRISRAQKLDALSSQANLGGYKAVLMAAAELPKIFPLLMTPAGTLRPARVVVMGAGVAGLQAVATAHRLGAIVHVSDIRPAVREQVESLGARFIDVPTDESMEGADGYAREASPEFLAEQAELTRKHLIDADVVITAALVPGKPAPLLVKEDVVQQMRPGSVIVDLAAEAGGNCELTEPGEVVVRSGVKIFGLLNLPCTLPRHASDIYASNIKNLLLDHIGEEGLFAWDWDDDIIKQAMAVYDGKYLMQQGGKH